MTEPLILLGGGGQAAVLAEILRQANRDIIALVSPDSVAGRPGLSGIPVLTRDDEVFLYSADRIRLVNGVGMIPGKILRKRLFASFRQQGYRFASVIAPSAIISSSVTLGEGVQIMPGAIVNAGAVIGDNTIINSGAVVEHDCHIGAHNHVAPGAVLSGQVTTGDGVHIGTGASIIQGVSIGAEAVVAAGAMLNRHLPAGHIVYAPRPVIKPFQY
ncbi:shikimate dehydrogenase [Zobellella endophytica]|uniref:Shikimate dehydrogenase n=1 Tax=Zobellella endophytica TaxID=2116700 RepID=A0A2P7R524_9GAMM|nr:acetyltransferase [Zobellella endophytica]PSJ45305.1 shikimate dehydrogenase [Zobellella endophytica]